MQERLLEPKQTLKHAVITGFVIFFQALLKCKQKQGEMEVKGTNTNKNRSHPEFKVRD